MGTKKPRAKRQARKDRLTPEMEAKVAAKMAEMKRDIETWLERPLSSER